MQIVCKSISLLLIFHRMKYLIIQFIEKSSINTKKLSKYYIDSESSWLPFFKKKRYYTQHIHIKKYFGHN